MQSLARHEEEGAEGLVLFFANTNGVSKRASTKERKVRIRGLASFAPVVLDVVPCIERKVILGPLWHMRGEAMSAVGLVFDEVPERHAAGRFHHSGGTVGWGVCNGGDGDGK